MNRSQFQHCRRRTRHGLSKDVLRMWERRYGFPATGPRQQWRALLPGGSGRAPAPDQTPDGSGHRPGKLIATPVEELAGFVARRAKARPGNESSDGSELSDLLALIKQHDSNGFQQAMQQRLARQGLQRFVQDTVAPLTFRRVGEAWEDGSVEVFEEHLFTELTKRLLRQAIATLPAASAARAFC
jgi:hypothetical protein